MVADINEDGAQQTVDDIRQNNGWAMAVKTDVACKEQVVALVERAAQEMSGRCFDDSFRSLAIH